MLVRKGKPSLGSHSPGEPLKAITREGLRERHWTTETVLVAPVAKWHPNSYQRNAVLY